MANSKNTIQQISLNGTLNMNTLKTEVKPFEGYNEKNSTVFGGTLSPFYDKETELACPSQCKGHYTFFNSKGQSFTLHYNGISAKLYKGNIQVPGVSGSIAPETIQLDVPDNTVVAAGIYGRRRNDVTIYVTEDRKVYKNNEIIYTFTDFEDKDILQAQIWTSDGLRIAAVTENKSVFLWFSNDFLVERVRYVDEGFGKQCMMTGGYDSSEFVSYIVSNSGRITRKPRIVRYNWDLDTYSSGCDYYQIETRGTFLSSEYIYFPSSMDNYKIDIYPCAYRVVEKLNNGKYNLKYDSSLPNPGSEHRYVGVDGTGFVPCPVGSEYSKNGSFYYLNGGLLSVGYLNQPIAKPLSFNRLMTTHIYFPILTPPYCTYQSSDLKWYSYVARSIGEAVDIEKGLKSLVFDKRYVFFRSTTGGLTVYDIEDERIVQDAKELDWIYAVPPYSPFVSWTPTGSIYCGGYNAGYMISNAKFVGYLPNPYVVKDGPPRGETMYVWQPKYAQTYFSSGSTVQSAEYLDTDPLYAGTTYAIDSNSNIIIPVSQAGKIINGYSNNDMVVEGSTTYPLMYWNNNQKTYSYFLLSGLENMTGAFSLQGQTYAVDDTNIYATSFNNGIVSNVQTVCYKKNMGFKGTLPSQAIFWSDFNKSFYAFTGDRIVRKMFEASGVGKINYVGQNPSSLSLWLCTDNGIYIISDTDIYKLNYNASTVDFFDQYAAIVEESNGKQKLHLISLYDTGNGGKKIPVKLKTAYYGLGAEQKAVMDCWYLRLFDENRTEGDVKVKVNTITDVTRHTEEKVFHINPSDYDDNNLVYLRYQPKYQECTAMQFELESPIGIYELAVGVNATDSTAQISKINF